MMRSYEGLATLWFTNTAQPWEALELLETDKPDLLLLDINLAGKKDGIDLAEKKISCTVFLLFFSLQTVTW